ncbi:hypothetical protein HDF16_002829 [Granulicella aggregans]|uniref:DUF4386 domain-containing protein n=1 Tax=Granulicella aggregans TaxID=474949 RepID=A0A7W7ZE79_9BACT|nr:DUF4386 domain-containing protein [Granulicella aggregans]MBB5058123.1 hypothetical protein [Granulicella aggregans]
MTSNRDLQSRRLWARVSGLAYLLVLGVDLTGLQLSHQLLGKWLMLAGSVFVVPLALGLYFTLKMFKPVTSAIALACRLVEVLIGLIVAVVRFDTVRSAFAGAHFGSFILEFVDWNTATSFDALIFTIGSTLFFFVFVRSVSIPRVLGWLGLVASILAFAACATHLVRPNFPALSAVLWIPMLLAELSTGGWLLIRSVPNAAIRTL